MPTTVNPMQFKDSFLAQAQEPLKAAPSMDLFDQLRMHSLNLGPSQTLNQLQNSINLNNPLSAWNNLASRNSRTIAGGFG